MIEIAVTVNHYFHGTAHDPRIDNILADTSAIKEQLMTNTQAFKDLGDRFESFKSAVTDGMANIRGDIQRLIDAKDQMTPENQAVVDSLEAGFTAMAQDVSTTAGIVPEPITPPGGDTQP
jgi:hypothetical protein